MTPEELVAATAGPINALGAIYYFHPDTLSHGKEQLGLDGMRFYFLARGGLVGDIDAATAASAFGYFAPPVMDKMWNSARERCAPRTAALASLECNANIARAALSDIEGLAAFCDAAEQVVADVNPAGLTLYAGAAAFDLPEDLPARAMQLVVVHRELRGSAPLCAVVGAGLHAGVAHAIRRPNDIETFGWPADIEITDADRERLAEVDIATDALSASHYASLSDEQRAAFAAGVSAIAAAFDT